MENNSINVLVVDDHTLFRKGMVMILGTFPEIEKVYDAENGQVALDFLQTNKVDIILLDLDMPVLDGWETALKVVELYPEIKIVMVSMYDSLRVVSKLISLGVHGYILKSAPPEEVEKAIDSVVNNNFYYNQLVARAVQLNLDAAEKKIELLDYTGLTKREVEIIELICQELTMKEIGEKLGLSEATVQTHRKNLMKKIDAKNTVGIVKYALQNELVTI